VIAGRTPKCAKGDSALRYGLRVFVDAGRKFARVNSFKPPFEISVARFQPLKAALEEAGHEIEAVLGEYIAVQVIKFFL
jgi:hypothetical protein